MDNKSISYVAQLKEIIKEKINDEARNLKEVNPINLNFQSDDVIQGLIYLEILGKPRSKRKRR